MKKLQNLNNQQKLIALVLVSVLAIVFIFLAQQPTRPTDLSQVNLESQICQDFDTVAKLFGPIFTEENIKESQIKKNTTMSVVNMLKENSPRFIYPSERFIYGNFEGIESGNLINQQYRNEIENKILGLGLVKEIEYYKSGTTAIQFSKGQDIYKVEIPSVINENTPEFYSSSLAVSCGRVDTKIAQKLSEFEKFFQKEDEIALWRDVENMVHLNVMEGPALAGVGFIYDTTKDNPELVWSGNGIVSCLELEKRKIGKGETCYDEKIEGTGTRLVNY